MDEKRFKELSLLYIDDSSDGWNRDMVSAFLSDIVRVKSLYVALSAEEGLNQGRSRRPDIVIVNMIKSIWSGVDVVRKMRRLHNFDLPVIYIGELQYRLSIESVLRGSPFRFVSKPLFLKDLLLSIHDLSSKKQITSLLNENRKIIA